MVESGMGSFSVRGCVPGCRKSLGVVGRGIPNGVMRTIVAAAALEPKSTATKGAIALRRQNMRATRARGIGPFPLGLCSLSDALYLDARRPSRRFMNRSQEVVLSRCVWWLAPLLGALFPLFGTAEPAPPLRPGEITDPVRCDGDPTFTYALY